MKRFYILMMVILAAPMLLIAQTNKPTKAQTEAHIKQWFDPERKSYFNQPDFTQVVKIKVNESKVEFIKNTIVKYNDYSTIDTTSCSIDLSKIEKIEYGLNEMESCLWRYCYYLQFTCSPGVKCCSINGELSNSHAIYMHTATEKEPKFEESLGTLVKAFNHLRKLHGAPDPISFD